MKFNRIKIFTWMALVGSVALFGCAVGLDQPSSAKGKQLFYAQCASCHGSGAEGLSAQASPIGRAIPNLTSLSAQNRGSFPTYYVMSKIYGLGELEHPKAQMPEFGQGDLGPLVQIETDGVSYQVPRDLVSLADYLSQLQKLPPD